MDAARLARQRDSNVMRYVRDSHEKRAHTKKQP
jgi:hypothetical protein